MKSKSLKISLYFGVSFCILFLFYFYPKIQYAKYNPTKDTLKSIQNHVKNLSQKIGERNLRKPKALQDTATYIKSFLSKLNLKVKTQKYEVLTNKDYLPVAQRKLPFFVENIYITLNANSKLNTLVIGAHYDTFIGTQGADDNASSVALLLEIIKKVSQTKLKRPIIFVFFTLEEPPFFQSQEMGSYQFAKMLKNNNTEILGMISLDCVGYFSEKQSYPFPLNLVYSGKGDFLALISSFQSSFFYKKIITNIKKSYQLEIKTFLLPSFLPGVSYSDHWSFEQFNYRGVLFSDSAFYRSNHYHEDTDTFQTLNYQKLSEFKEILQNLVLIL
ncbi:MAG: hypothetical protein COB02_13225 [Candidatus Cloacimonadota bacterium]|nr:MAG: hypothetical protein COB02_13225 [Candidatus Cloacimonadota bacterium]